MTDIEKQAEEIYMKLQIIDQNIKNLQKQAQIIEMQFAELMMTSQSIDEFKKIKTDSNILVPFGPGLYAKADLKNNKELIVSIGAGVAVKKDADSAKKLVEAQLEQMHEIRKTMASELEKLVKHAEIYQNELQKLVSMQEAK